MSDKSQRWLWSLLVNVALAQASIYVMRPMITYRALENGASTYEIGLIAAIAITLLVKERLIARTINESEPTTSKGASPNLPTHLPIDTATTKGVSA